ncbi:glycosyltransferase family 1 protein [Flavobacterium sp. RSP49]|uniref:glycosyltransferase n=1 Tax=Flavobacterium sp. RSP49 TaxID=2497487 RepID=UPI000F83E449|nr:glycosyltransferase [Flavobacterium sp. RSP49]RTZ00891.1 glycosyltransferase family 1 protein [Flavobacterium sp. RSP49]
MKVLLDNSNLFAGGGLQVAVSFLRDLKKIQSPVQFHVIQSCNCVKSLGDENFPENFIFYNLGQKEQFSKLKRIISVKNIENTIRPNCIFTLFGPSYHKSNYPKIVGFAIPHIIYPNSPFFSKISFKEKLSLFLLNKLKEYMFKRNSDALIFESEYARNFFASKISNKTPTYCVNNTLNETFLQTDNWKEISLEKTSIFNILCLSANYVHKNITIIPEVIDVLISRYKFFDFTFHISQDKKDLDFGDKYDNYINYLGKVDLSKLPSLYSKMQLLFMPTLLEVFSTTYLEAMFMNIPIVASDMPFAHDVCSDAALYCSPTDPSEYADKIYQIINNSELKNELILNGSKNILKFGNSMGRTNKYLKIIENFSNENTK